MRSAAALALLSQVRLEALLHRAVTTGDDPEKLLVRPLGECPVVGLVDIDAALHQEDLSITPDSLDGFRRQLATVTTAVSDDVLVAHGHLTSKNLFFDRCGLEVPEICCV